MSTKKCECLFDADTVEKMDQEKVARLKNRTYRFRETLEQNKQVSIIEIPFIGVRVDARTGKLSPTQSSFLIAFNSETKATMVVIGSMTKPGKLGTLGKRAYYRPRNARMQQLMNKLRLANIIHNDMSEHAIINKLDTNSLLRECSEKEEKQDEKQEEKVIRTPSVW